MCPMCQPRRPSPAQRQAEANAEVERIAHALYEVLWSPSKWEALQEEHRKTWRGYVITLIRDGVIAPVPRPKSEPPMTGQTEIGDFIEPTVTPLDKREHFDERDREYLWPTDPPTPQEL